MPLSNLAVAYRNNCASKCHQTETFCYRPKDFFSPHCHSPLPHRKFKTEIFLLFTFVLLFTFFIESGQAKKETMFYLNLTLNLMAKNRHDGHRRVGGVSELYQIRDDSIILAYGKFVNRTCPEYLLRVRDRRMGASKCNPLFAYLHVCSHISKTAVRLYFTKFLCMHVDWGRYLVSFGGDAVHFVHPVLLMESL